MKLKELFEFKDYISSHSISLNNAKDALSLQDLFKKFSEYEINTKKDYSVASSHFRTTMIHLYKHINTSEDFTRDDFIAKLNTFCQHIHSSLNPTFARIQQQTPYVDVVKELIPSSSKVLDVGAGIVPHSSFMMAPAFKEVHTLDKFAISEKSLSPFHVKPRDGYFEESTNIENVDFIVGNRPCTAIQRIVEQASQHNKGYVLKLCDCALSSIANENNNVYRTWNEILPEIDSNIHFCENYAYNIDATEDQFLKITEAAQCDSKLSLFAEENPSVEQQICNAKVYFEEYNCEE